MIHSPVEPDTNSTPSDISNTPSWARYAEVAVALCVVAMGIVILIETQDIRVPKAFTSVGPRVVPTIIGWGLIVVGAWYAIEVLIGKTAVPAADAEDADPTLPANWSVLAGLAATLLLYAFLMKPAGFVIASTVLFTLSAIVMGSRHFLRDFVIGLAAAVLTYLVFSEWLGIRLPPGLLDRFF